MAKRKVSSAKVDALQHSGTLNPHPEEIKDELFQHSSFFDPHDLMQVKYEMIRRVSVDGWSVSQASRTFGFSRPSFYLAQTEFDQSGLPGFIPKRRGPQSAHKLSPSVLAFLEKCRVENPSLHTSDLVRLAKEEFGIDIHKRSIERAFNRSKKKPNL